MQYLCLKFSVPHLVSRNVGQLPPCFSCGYYVARCRLPKLIACHLLAGSVFIVENHSADDMTDGAQRRERGHAQQRLADEAEKLWRELLERCHSGKNCALLWLRCYREVCKLARTERMYQSLEVGVAKNSGRRGSPSFHHSCSFCRDTDHSLIT